MPRAAAPRLRPASIAALALAALVLVLAGCGSSHSSGSAIDPATVVPASAPLYAAADVRPEGAERSDALAAGTALTHEADPYVRLLAALQTPGSPPLDFARDVDPWLGPRAGVFLSSLRSASALLPILEQGLLGRGSATPAFLFGRGAADGALVLDTSDAAKARSFLEKQAERAGAHPAAYRGVTYRATAGGVAFGLVGALAVIGSEPGLRQVIDTGARGSALAHAAGYSKLLAAAPKGALAHIYADPTVSAGRAGAPGAGLLSLLTGAQQANVSLVASAGALVLDADTLAGPGRRGLLSGGAEGARALGELPGDSWLAAGLAHLGTTLGSDIAGLKALAALGSGLAGSQQAPSTSGLSIKGLVEGLIVPLALLGAETPQARHDFTSWMGSGSIFASGSSLLELKGAVVIESKDPALSHAAVAKLAAALQRTGSTVQPATIAGTDAAVGAKVNGLPLILDIASGRDSAGHAKFVLGLGEASVAAALSPSSTLSSAPARSEAATALGEGIEPSIALQLPTLLSLLEGVGLTEDPTVAKLVPYLRAISAISGGGHPLGGEVERFKLVLGLAPGG